MRVGIFVAALCLLGLGASASSASAAPVTFVVHGEVSSVDSDARVQSFSGSTFVGFYTFESTQPGGHLVPGLGGYVGTSQISFSNGFSRSDGDTFIRVFDNFGQILDGYDVGLTEIGPSGLPGLTFNGAYMLSLRDFTQTALQSTDLLLVPPDLNDFSDKVGLINFVDLAAHANVNVNLRISSIDLVPEPTSIVLFSAGVAGVGFSCRRWKWAAQRAKG